MSRAIIKNTLANLVAFLILYNVLSFAIFLWYGDITPILWWLAVPFFLMQLVRAKASNAYVFAILYIILGVCVWFVFGNWFAMGFMLAVTIYSFRVKGGGEWEPARKTGIIVLVTHVAMFAFAQRLSAAGAEVLFRQQLAGTCIAQLGFIIMYIHMGNIDISLRMLPHKGDDRLATGRILRNNNILIIAFTAMVVLVGLVVAALPLGRVFAAGWGAIRMGLSGITARFARQQPTFDFAENAPINYVARVEADRFIFVSPESLYFGYLPDGMEADEFQAVSILDPIILWGGVLIGVVVIVINFIRYFVNISRRRNSTKSSNDEKTSLVSDILGDIRDLLPRFGRYSKNAIRRAYTKKVNWHIKRGIKVKMSDTTDIIADKIRSIEDIDELTTMYEQVRYFR